MKSLVEQWYVNTIIQPYSLPDGIIKDTDTKNMSTDVGVSFVNAKDHTKDIYWRTTLPHVDMYKFEWPDIVVFSPIVGHFNVGYFMRATWKRTDPIRWFV